MTAARVDPRVAIEGRWYAPLLRPVWPTVHRALEQVIEGEGDPWALPRTGLGGAVAIQVARGFGSRPPTRLRKAGRRAERIAVAALEGYNQRLHLGEPLPEQRLAWLTRDLGWARAAWESLLDHDEPTLTRVLDRLFGVESAAGDLPIPEAVLFLRGAVATGVVLGEVPESVHVALDRHVTWVGLAWEAGRGGVDERAWAGALRAIGLDPRYPADPLAHAHAEALAALAELPRAPPVELFMTALADAPRESPMPRRPPAWTPEPTPKLAPERALAPGRTPGRPDAGPGSTLAAQRERWAAGIEQALAELTASRSRTLTDATGFLRGQAGKRVRPLLTLAAAEACAGDPRRALPIAAAVEWLHQGSLLLDDIIDAAELRRGHPTLHRATSPEFAIGVAGFVFARVVRESHAMHPEIRRWVVRAATALVEGERLELRHTGDAELTLAQYYAIIEAKTARLFACAAAVGGLAVEAAPKQVAALARFGRELGLAFQIVDDVLDYEGEAERLGKLPGIDLRAAKLTLPLLLVRERLEPAELVRLRAALGQGSEAELAWVRERLLAHEVGPRCRARAVGHLARARAAIERLPDGPGRATLVAFAEQLGERQS